MTVQRVSVSILGSAGGVARAILSLLNKSITDPNDPIHSLMNQSKLHFIDYQQKDINYYKQICPDLVNRIDLYQFNLEDLEMVRKHIDETKTSLIIDLSWADTIDILKICNDLGVSYVNSALENVEVDKDVYLEGFTLTERFERFSAVKNSFTNMKGIVCSGMNPGVVQWMAHSLMIAHPNEKPLACYIVEKDTTFFKDKSHIRKNTIYSSWSPECYLDEAILNYPMFVKQHVPFYLYDYPYAKEYKVKLGDIEFYGCLMPHEEVLSLGTMYDMETGFIYQVNDYTTKIIRDNLENADDLWEWEFEVFDPSVAEIVGEDLVGILLVYNDKERFMYNVMDNQFAFQKHGINATYLQVACGVYAAVCTLLLDPVPAGVHYVEELLKTDNSIGYGKYVSQYMTDFIIGENARSDGFILNRMRDFKP
ncbi:S-adenosylmethionine decarboxylase related protein [Peribacillus alkalitolerans]|uniref:S-adenosylmethionine decarboxylase related protein n=1 Tax=Peribacillus alkalitolerans TaxID=1550385 RepID=UPI0013D35A43|nr:S-adenosylmethionine decarboxylase related protein [Peribacillus alkalitolerans]